MLILNYKKRKIIRTIDKIIGRTAHIQLLDN